MMAKVRSATCVLAGIVAALGFTTVRADSLGGYFLDHDGLPSSTLGGRVFFTLEGDGTVRASLTSFSGGIVGFGFDSPPLNLPESGFPPGQPGNPFGWGTVHYGAFFSGFRSNGPFPTSIDWTIGNPGDYTSVWQALGTVNANWDFYLLSDSEWGAVASAIPEPGMATLLTAGVVALSLVARRQRRIGE